MKCNNVFSAQTITFEDDGVQTQYLTQKLKRIDKSAVKTMIEEEEQSSGKPKTAKTIYLGYIFHIFFNSSKTFL